jgi:SAM-dependent methyltransferase
VAPFVPTPEKIVEYMLELSEVDSKDILYDLGCGDGRILFMAVEHFGVGRAVGYELNSGMVQGVKEKIRERELAGRIEVYNQNFFDADISPASVVTLYLTTSGNAKLRPKFESELRSGARVVSHDFPIKEWDSYLMKGRPHVMGSHKVFLYTLPK